MAWQIHATGHPFVQGCGMTSTSELSETAPETWASIIQPHVRRFEVAAAVGGQATYNATGSVAMAKLLREMADKTDQAIELSRNLEARLASERAAGREEAAKVAETRHEYWHMPHPDDAKPFEVCDDVSACADIAAAIRAIGEKQ